MRSLAQTCEFCGYLEENLVLGRNGRFTRISCGKKLAVSEIGQEPQGKCRLCGSPYVARKEEIACSEEKTWYLEEAQSFGVKMFHKNRDDHKPKFVKQTTNRWSANSGKTKWCFCKNVDERGRNRVPARHRACESCTEIWMEADRDKTVFFWNCCKFHPKGETRL